MFNFNQKKLQKMIHMTKGIHINGQPVSRAWVKLWELYNETKYFDNIKQDTVKAFHICEAPGNFVASSMEYIKRDRDMSQYDWTAQSLYDGEIWDQYGFIEQNKSKWDFGKDGTGNIMNYDNLMHYLGKYQGIDSLVGDCGVPWTPDSDPTKDLSVYQMIYALLFPRVGGNFIIKTYAVNYNLQFLAFLMVACSRYEKLFFFRSSRNFWSPEMYVVGIGNKGLSDDEKNKLLDIVKAMDKGEILFPMEYIPSEFGIEYEYYTHHIINIFVEIKKFFVYLARNQDKLEEMKDDIEKAFIAKNKYWLKKNF
jgi:cap2 methyltransferase